MARTPANFSHNNQLSSAAEDLISAVQASEKQIIRKLSFRNTGTTTRTVTVYIVESGGTADTGTELDVKGIPGGGVWNVLVAQGEVLTSGMTLQAKQDTGTDINSNCSGSTVT